ncbi:hypothetical protein [Ralstonia syzygii]|uniref:Uncharacterized protein n=1 Tax=Ralstonia syzygii R24 TaxID=907261 RepID=G3A3U9_9RALS|nr:hypothetical protein [Ralstonia syzygii]CCA88560.1 conserved hypothetical protein [Ralstonia syzygii R24]
MSAMLLSSTARADRGRCVWLDLLIGPVSLALVLLFSLLVPVRVHAQVNMTLGQLMPNLIRNTSQVVTASASGLQVAEAGSVAIGSGSSMIGSVAINELRVIPLARIAARVATASAPIMLAMLAVDLIQYGITQCSQSGTGWCGPGLANSHQNDVNFNGSLWCFSGGVGTATGCYDSLDSACAAAYSSAGGGWMFDYSQIRSTSGSVVSGACYGHNGTDLPTNYYAAFSADVSASSCVSGYVWSGGKCVVDASKPLSPLPMTYPQLSDKLAQALSGNPNRAKDYWGVMSPSDWYAALAEPTTQALPAQIVNPTNGQVVGPKTTTTTSAGTSTSQTTYTVSPNTDSGTLASNPVTVTTTTTTTNPDGTTSTTTTTTSPTSQDGANPQPQPASAPFACGLGTVASPACKIDETGTPTKVDAATAMTSPATDLQTARQSSESQLTNATKGLSWTLSMPHILPGGTCQPIEWFSWGQWRGVWDVCTQLQYVRDLLAWLWPVLAGVYVWNKAAGANVGVV